MPRKVIDRIGERMGTRTIIARYYPKRPARQALWVMRCDCGSKVISAYKKSFSPQACIFCFRDPIPSRKILTERRRRRKQTDGDSKFFLLL